MVLCERYGHEIVALANLLPLDTSQDDIDSWMYQTVGHQVIEAYARCANLPLYRRKITGGSLDKTLVYHDTQGDEVEDLAALLSWVKTEIPDIQAVASGAIASDYQRTRVERVCSRLGLISLAYLWHQPQATLFQRMIDYNIDAVLVKVAAAGLDPSLHLGKTLSHIQAHLLHLRDLYGSNICGEGGEYETLTLDCPLFKKESIVLTDVEIIRQGEDSVAPVGVLHTVAFEIEYKRGIPGSSSNDNNNMNNGGGNEEENWGRVIDVPDDYTCPNIASSIEESEGRGVDTTKTSSSYTSRVKTRQVSGITTISFTLSAAPGTPPTTSSGADALSYALGTIATKELGAYQLTWEDAVFVHLYISSMSDFGSINITYAQYLPSIDPPARATVQLQTRQHHDNNNNNKQEEEEEEEEEVQLSVDIIFTNKGTATNNNSSSTKKVLHVQSISEWAPSCIGPYAQAVMLDDLVYFAGQIALDPPTMNILLEQQGNLSGQCVRSLMSCDAVAVAMKTNLPQAMLWCSVYLSEEACESSSGSLASSFKCSVGLVQSHLDTYLATGVAGLDGKNGDDARNSGSSISSSISSDDDDNDDALDTYLTPPDMKRCWEPMICYIAMPVLPRNAMVEIQPVACLPLPEYPPSSSSSSASDDEDNGNEEAAINNNNNITTRKRYMHAIKKLGGSIPDHVESGEHSRVEYEGVLCPGWFCRMFVCISIKSNNSNANNNNDDDDGMMLAGVQEAIDEALSQAELTYDDVAVCKLYYCSGIEMQESVRLEKVEKALAPLTVTSVVPVVAVGLHRNVPSAAIAIEIFALH
jgi:diphthine-ammonia ligase